MTHPLSTANLLALAATASTEPDHHHVEAAYQAAQAIDLLTDDGSTRPDFDYDLAADVAALRMALAAASSLAGRLAEHDHPALPDFLHRIVGHYASNFDAFLADQERNADALTP